MQTLEELATYIRETIPTPRAILQLKVSAKAGGVIFIWNGVEFFVNPSLQALEVRGNTLYITGLSTLLQCVLAGRNQSEKKLGSVLDQISEAEALLREPRLSHRGAELLRFARTNLEEMVPKRSDNQAPQIPLPRSQSAYR